MKISPLSNMRVIVICRIPLPPFKETFTLRRSSIERSNFVREFLDRNGVESRRKRGTVYFLSSKRVVEFFTRRTPTRFVAGDVEAWPLWFNARQLSAHARSCSRSSCYLEIGLESGVMPRSATHRMRTFSTRVYIKVSLNIAYFLRTFVIYYVWLFNYYLLCKLE